MVGTLKMKPRGSGTATPWLPAAKPAIIRSCANRVARAAMGRLDGDGGERMKIGLYSITYMGLWYDGPALSFEEFAKRARGFGYDGVELDGKRPHGNPMDLDRKARDAIRNVLEREGLEIPCVAANNDFSSPIPEHR